MINEFKICVNCKKLKPRDEFYPCGTTLDKRTDKCKECYIREKEVLAEMKALKGKKLNPDFPQKKLSKWAAIQTVYCPSPTSKPISPSR